jgi:hypothetical protein
LRAAGVKPKPTAFFAHEVPELFASEHKINR